MNFKHWFNEIALSSPDALKADERAMHALQIVGKSIETMRVVAHTLHRQDPTLYPAVMQDIATNTGPKAGNKITVGQVKNLLMVAYDRFQDAVQMQQMLSNMIQSEPENSDLLQRLHRSIILVKQKLPTAIKDVQQAVHYRPDNEEF